MSYIRTRLSSQLATHFLIFWLNRVSHQKIPLVCSSARHSQELIFIKGKVERFSEVSPASGRDNGVFLKVSILN